AGAVSKGPSAESQRDPAKSDDHNGQWQSAGPVMHTEDGERTRNEPIVEWRFFQIRYTVEPRRDPIAGLKHVAADLCLDGIDVVHQMWRTERTAEKNHGGDENNDQVRLGTPTGDEIRYSMRDGDVCIFHFFIHRNRIISPHR